MDVPEFIVLLELKESGIYYAAILDHGMEAKIEHKIEAWLNSYNVGPYTGFLL